MTNRNLSIATVCCVAIASASLLVAAEPVYDAWAWLVWGRELAGLALDTSSGPSFKPLPVAITSLLSLAGDAAPQLWLLLVRASWLLALVLAGALAHRLSAGLGRRPQAFAAAFAGLSLALLRDDVTMWARQGAAGMSEPLLVALVLGAVAAGLEQRSRTALVLGALAALIRPEVWPLLAAYGLWRWRAQPALRPWLAALAVAVPALWIVPGVLSAGDAASAGERARRGAGAPAGEMLEALWRGVQMPLLAAWPLALYAIAGSRRRRRAATGAAAAAPSPGSPARTRTVSGGPAPNDPRIPAGTLLVLFAGAVAWIAVVVIMAGAGFAGLPRFMAPAAALIGVIAGVGLARRLASGQRPRRDMAAVALLLLVVAQVAHRAGELPHSISTTARIARSHDDLRRLAGEIGRDRLLRCGRLATSDVLVRTALAWELGVPLGDVVTFGDLPAQDGAFVVGSQASPLLAAFMRGHADLAGERGEWRVYSLGCPPAGAADSSSSASVRITGVSGADL